MSDGGSEEKSEAASDKKLRDLRAKGIIPSAPTASDFVGFSVALATALGIAGFMIDRLMGAFDTAFNQLNKADARDNIYAVKYYLMDLNAPLLAILGAAAAGGVIFKVLSQGGFVFAMERIQFNLGAVNPVQGFKNMFKMEALTNFLTSFIRLTIMLIVLVGLALYWGGDMFTLDLCSPYCIWPIVWSIVRTILMTVAIIVIVTIMFDIAVQKHFFMEQQKMTQTEVKQEQKDMMGKPEVRQERKRIANEMAEGGEAIGASKAAIFFAWKDNVVAFAFDPVKIPLPKVAARARGREACQLLVANLLEREVPGYNNQEIVEACIDSKLGEPAKREIFMPLAQHLRRL